MWIYVDKNRFNSWDICFVYFYIIKIKFELSYKTSISLTLWLISGHLKAVGNIIGKKMLCTFSLTRRFVYATQLCSKIACGWTRPIKKATYINEINKYCGLGGGAFWFLKKKNQTGVLSYVFEVLQSSIYFFVFQMCFVRKINSLQPFFWSMRQLLYCWCNCIL